MRTTACNHLPRTGGLPAGAPALPPPGSAASVAGAVFAAVVAPRTRGLGRRRSRPRAGGFTLIELILVMGLLLIVTGISIPSLKNFFRGRALDSEARRFLSLTRYAQSRAAAEGLPMVLWVDVQEGTYGLQAETGYLDLDRRAVVYDIDETLTVEATAPPVPAITPGSSGLGSSLNSRSRSSTGNATLPALRITAEGYIDDTSPEAIVFRQGDNGNDSASASVWIVQSGNRLNYEISANPPVQSRR